MPTTEGQPLPGHQLARDPETTAAHKPRTGRLWIGLVLGLLVYGGLVLWGDAGGMLLALRRVPLWAVGVALACSFANYVVRFPRWQGYLRQLDVELEPGPSFLIYLSGLALTVSPGKLGEALKSWLLQRVNGTPIARTAPIVLAERLTDLFGFLVLIVIGGLLRGGGNWWLVLGTLALCATLIGLIAAPRARHSLLRLSGRLPLVSRYGTSIEASLESASVLLAPRALLVPTLLAALGWGLECLGFWVLASQLLEGTDGLPSIGVGFALQAFATSAVIGALVVFLPGGLGVTEGSLVAQTKARFIELGQGAEMAAAGAAAATILIRLCTLWFAMLIGMLAWGLFEQRMRRRSAAE